MRIRPFGAVLLACACTAAVVVVILPAVASGRSGSIQTVAQDHAFAHMDHVFVIMMENTAYSDLLSPSNSEHDLHPGHRKHVRARDELLRRHAYEPPELRRSDERQHLGLELPTTRRRPTRGTSTTSISSTSSSRPHVSWKGYMESMPSAGYTGDYGDCSSNRPRTAPSSLDRATRSTSASTTRSCSTRTSSTTRRALDKVVPLTTAEPRPEVRDTWRSSCGSRRTSATTCTAGRPECPYPNTPTDQYQATLYQDGDTLPATWVTAIMSSPAWTGHSAIFVTWDEGGYEDVSPYGPRTTAAAATRPCSRATPADPTIGRRR